MGSLIAWLDYSEDDQRRLREVLRTFEQPGTVDDLGVGTIRDLISNALFPGTSVIQTRARYFLFVPWIFQRAEQRPARMLEDAERMERRLITALLRSADTEGVIGRVAGANVRTLPSAIYWVGLARLGIFRGTGLTIRQYARNLSTRTSATEFEDELVERQQRFWSEMPPPRESFFEFETESLDLSVDEADWLIERIVATEQHDGQPNLLAAFARDVQRGRVPHSGHDLWDGPLPAGTAPEVALLVDHAHRLSAAMYGANLLYNHSLLRLREERHGSSSAGDLPPTADPDWYLAELEQWAADGDRLHLQSWAADFATFWDVLPPGRSQIPERVRRFLRQWLGLLATHSLESIPTTTDALALIRSREQQHKRGQSRYTNGTRLASFAGGVGLGSMRYRWDIVSRHLNDIATSASGPGEVVAHA